MVSEFPEGIKTMQTTTPEMGTIPRFTSTSTAHPERVAIPQPIPLLPKSEYGTPEHIASVEKHFGAEVAQQVIARQQAIENAPEHGFMARPARYWRPEHSGRYRARYPGRSHAQAGM
jgi:hypothetical protein